jgi:uncharacterized membrane-anchored protein YitT (DUF2179 family)
MKNILKSVFLLLGICSASFGIKGFLIPNRFIDGGVTGVSMFLSAISGVHIWIFVVVINIPFLVMAFYHMNRRFLITTSISIGLFALMLALVPFPMITHDKLLTSVFGGVLLGAGIGCAIRGGGVLDGTEILALYLSRTNTATVGTVILMFNVVLFSVAAIFLGIESALYSILTYFAASKTVDFVLYGIEGYSGATIISTKNRTIREAIISELKRGVTVYKAKGGMCSEDMEVLFCVLTRLELPDLKKIVYERDPSAVLFVHHITDAMGGVLKRRALQEPFA